MKVSSVEKIVRHIDQRQVTFDLSGLLAYNHEEWLKLRAVSYPTSQLLLLVYVIVLQPLMKYYLVLVTVRPIHVCISPLFSLLPSPFPSPLYPPPLPSSPPSSLLSLPLPLNLYEQQLIVLHFGILQSGTCTMYLFTVISILYISMLWGEHVLYCL